MVIRKIELMHHMFGKEPEKKCGECKHLKYIKYYNRPLRKCEIYGLTHSEASDWAKKYEACGMFNKDYCGGNIIRLISNCKEPLKQLDGQIGLEELEGELTDED